MDINFSKCAATFAFLVAADDDSDEHFDFLITGDAHTLAETQKQFNLNDRELTVVRNLCQSLADTASAFLTMDGDTGDDSDEAEVLEHTATN